ncbi:MAG: bifunctional phosphoribosyl-AMP cyclohydrolase/phosphoribosyl-ATP diphosphatase HisIE [Oscillospiraceae bacterium]|nr:bifunctional phosphoribosyl-AMP cyclohydrolase/phosphoribosyl-ATP diphosphatase HisIE [Oscillospiraceae bacterium]
MSGTLELKFNSEGLIPAVLQDAQTKEILMLAYMNKEAFDKTVETGKATFYSRSRKRLWTKGEESGNFMSVRSIYVDCDADSLVILVNPEGDKKACHTGKRSCFYRKAENGGLVEQYAEPNILEELIEVANDRKVNPQEGSYTNYLFEKGPDKILKKVGEEACEVVIAGKNGDKSEISYETADLMYHLSVMLSSYNMSWSDIYDELRKRR